MNWDKAKNLTILFLLMLNIFLGSLVFYAGRKYNMTSAQEDAIAKYLSQNSVSLYTTMPKSYRPMAALRIQAGGYSANELVPAFFGGTENVAPKPSLDGLQSVYTRGEETLTVNGNSFTYENKAERPGFVLTRSNAIDACSKFLSKHEGVFGKFAIDRVKEAEDGYTVICSGKFKSYLVTSNTMAFYITSSGISRVDGTYSQPVALSGEAKEIISPDEALYVFVKNMNYIYGDQEILLDNMDVVYYLAEAAADSSIQLNAAPYYRFYVFGDAQVMINAYTGEVYRTIY